MANSMTGFGRGTSTDGGKTFIIEIKSVNHRFQEVSVKLPRTFMSLEDRIRTQVKNSLKRGKVDIYITQKDYEKESTEAVLNISLAESYLKCFKTLSEKFGLRDDVTVGSISRYPEVISLEQKEEDLEKVWSIMEKALQQAIENLLSMRKQEGKKLEEDLLNKCTHITQLVDSVKERSPLVVLEYKNKLSARLKDLMDEVKNYDEGRVAMEIAIFADKASIDEEITRLYSHVEQIKSTLNLNESIGRKLDFIVQEMNREANTIASKANDLEILNYTLELKNDIEKIREQVQNIE
ncbi:YicC family protein [Clostridiaceae bacterium 14S0207]|nr:YicC family protein [Clostridiaceae bacterium 14S0207]